MHLRDASTPHPRRPPPPPPPQSKKRGLSLEEKKAAILEIFHESRDVFQLKARGQRWRRRRRATPASTFGRAQAARTLAPPPQDIEKLGPKRGVIPQSIKEVVQARVRVRGRSNPHAPRSLAAPPAAHAPPPHTTATQALVDDDLLHSERIGISNFFWCARVCVVRTRRAP